MAPSFRVDDELGQNSFAFDEGQRLINQTESMATGENGMSDQRSYLFSDQTAT